MKRPKQYYVMYHLCNHGDIYKDISSQIHNFTTYYYACIVFGVLTFFFLKIIFNINVSGAIIKTVRFIAE